MKVKLKSDLGSFTRNDGLFYFDFKPRMHWDREKKAMEKLWKDMELRIHCSTFIFYMYVASHNKLDLSLIFQDKTDE